MVDAREYHELTKHTPEKLRESGVTLDPATKPRPYKQYTDRPREELERIRPPQVPALSAVAHSRAAPGGNDGQPPTMDRDALATLCYEASGIIRRATVDDGREMLFRAASCTGKLYHIDLYPVVGEIDGLAAGVYHFDPRTCSLDVLREGDYRGLLTAAVGAGAGKWDGSHDDSHPVADAPVTIIATSTWWRNAWKYRERTYRHAFWDAGTVLANLLATAHAMDRRAMAVSAFADSPVADLLGIDPEWEAPVALAPVGRGDPTPDTRPVERIDPDTEPVSPEVTEYPLIHDAWQASTLPDGDAVADWRAHAVDSRGIGTVGPGDGERVPLDPVSVAEQSRRPLYATIRRRRSCREYADDGPSRRQLGTVLDRGLRGVPGDWTDGATSSSESTAGTATPAGLAFNDCYVLATGVDGVPDGTYQYHPEERALERIGDATSRDQQRLALNQGWAGDAQVNVYLLADVERLVGALGNRGYRLAQLEAGITLGRLYLATYAHRALGGTGLTFFDDLVTEHCSPRAAGQTPTCLFAFGRAPR